MLSVHIQKLQRAFWSSPSAENSSQAPCRNNNEPNEVIEAASVLAPSTTLTHLPSEIQKIIFDFVFHHREIVFTSFRNSKFDLRTSSNAWSLSILRASKTIFTISSEALEEAISKSKLIYKNCLPPHHYPGTDYIHAELGGADYILDRFFHERFLEKYRLYFRNVEISGFHPYPQLDMHPFPTLETVTVGTLIWKDNCYRKQEEAMEDYVYDHLSSILRFVDGCVSGGLAALLLQDDLRRQTRIPRPRQGCAQV